MNDMNISNIKSTPTEKISGFNAIKLRFTIK